MEDVPRFYKHGNAKHSVLFKEFEILPLSESSNGVVIHPTDIEILDDSNTHLYFSEPPFRSEKKIHVYLYNSREILPENYPEKIYLLEGDDISDYLYLDEFLKLHFYFDKESRNGDEELFISLRRKEDGDKYPFEEFISTPRKIDRAHLKDYLKEILISMGVDSEDVNYVLVYINYFEVAFTASDFNPNPESNYELLEAIGDTASWYYMTKIFLEYMEKNKIVPTEKAITGMHRTFASKYVQAKLSRDLQLPKFLLKKGAIDVSAQEDIFESMTGAFYVVNEYLKQFIDCDLRLAERFLRWVYMPMDLNVFELKPEITTFYDYMRIITIKRKFIEKTERDYTFMKCEKNVDKLLYEGLKEFFPKEDEKLKKNINIILKKIGEPYGQRTTDLIESRRLKFKEVNEMIENFFGEDNLRIIKLRQLLSDWSDETIDKLAKVAKEKYRNKFFIDRRYVDAAKTDYYWVFQDENKEDIVSTLNYDDMENPDLFVSLINNEEIIAKQINPRNVKKIPYNGDGDYLDEEGNKYTLQGNKYEIEEFLKELPESSKFYIKVSSGEYMFYSPYPEIKFGKNFDLNFLRGKLKFHKETKYPESIYKYIGDRISYGILSMIAISKYHVSDEDTLNKFKNLYRAKLLKDNYTRLLNIRNSSGELIHYDHLLGMNPNDAESVITHIHTNIEFNSGLLNKPEATLKKLNMALTYNADRTLAKSMEKKEFQDFRKARGNIKISNTSYQYTSSRGKSISVDINGHHYAQLKYYFAKYLIDYEKKNDPRWNMILNQKYTSFLNYDHLCQIFQMKGIEEWEITSDDSGQKLTVSFIFSGIPYLIKGSDIQIIIKQLP